MTMLGRPAVPQAPARVEIVGQATLFPFDVFSSAIRCIPAKRPNISASTASPLSKCSELIDELIIHACDLYMLSIEPPEALEDLAFTFMPSRQ